MRRLPSRLRRLDGALADLPLEEPMLLTELDGFLTGIVVCPEPIPPAEWMQAVWGSDENGVAAFEDPVDVQWFADAVAAQYGAIVRDLERGRLQPIFDIDERNGEVIWEAWIDGFAEAMEMWPDGWAASAASDDPGLADAVSRMAMLIAIARNESPLDSVQINARQDRVPTEIGEIVDRLYASRCRDGGEIPVASVSVSAGKIGRNDPCRCGSGRKSKRCCGDG